MATQIWVYSSSGNGLLPDGTKPMLTCHQRLSGAFTWDTFHRKELIHNVCSEITHLKLLSWFPGTNCKFCVLVHLHHRLTLYLIWRHVLNLEDKQKHMGYKCDWYSSENVFSKSTENHSAFCRFLTNCVYDYYGLYPSTMPCSQVSRFKSLDHVSRSGTPILSIFTKWDAGA